MKYTNSAFWNGDEQRYDIVNFGFFNLVALSRMTESRRPITFEWDRSFFSILERTKFLTFDYDFYRTLSPALRRLYLIANRDGWNQRDSGIFLADDFAIHQIGYNENHPLALRMQKLKKLLAAAAEADIIRPYEPWGGYFQPINRGRNRGETALRWTRGPALRQKPAAADERRVYRPHRERCALRPGQELCDEDGKPLCPQTFRRLVTRFGRERDAEAHPHHARPEGASPRSFHRSELAAFINRLQHDHAEPDWYQDLKRAERLSLLSEVQPNQLSMDLYGTFFQK